MTRVVVTGLGCVTAAGMDLGTTWENVKSGTTGIERIAQWDVEGWDYPLGGEVKDYKPKKMLADRKLLKVLSRQDVLGLFAANQAIDHSGMLSARGEGENKKFNDRTGVFAGSPGNKYRQQYDYIPLLAKSKGKHKEFGEGLFDEVHPMWLLKILPNNVLAYIGIQHGFKGPNENITNHGVGGVQAIIEAYRHMKAGHIDRAVVSAYEAGVEPEGVTNYASMGILSKEGIRPFSADRTGTILGEGAGGMVVETLEEARARNAPVYGEVLGGATTSEAHGVLPIREDGEGLARAINGALKDAGVKAGEVGFIVAHGNGTTGSDATEAQVIKELFGDGVPVTGFKWCIGHTLSAAGVIEGALALLSLKEGKVPGIPNLGKRGHDCAIGVSADAQTPKSDTILVINRGYASLNSCVVLRKVSE